MPHVLNISAYKFVPLADPEQMRSSLAERARELALKGTVLLASEGINLFLAGPEAAVRAFLAHLRAEACFADLEAKESWSERQPFGRLLVKVKAEIIRMNHPAIRPDAGRAPAVDAPTLARWLDQGQDDQGRPVVTLDTRNAFEVERGAFEGAVDWGLRKFSDFPAAARAHASSLQGKTVVSYCTGGIRCEKAALYLRETGLDHVYQLDGGILRYFELAQGRHFRGECFVFDERETLDARLQAGRDAA